MNLYRKNVAAIIINEKGEIWLGKRSDGLAWGFVQGGIEENERPEEAIVRELYEEIGTREFDLIAQCPQTLKYDFPSHMTFPTWTYKGQEQHYFLVKLHKNALINLESKPDEIEFSTYKWLDISEIRHMDFGFKNEVYHKALDYFSNEIEVSCFLAKANPEEYNFIQKYFTTEQDYSQNSWKKLVTDYKQGKFGKNIDCDKAASFLYQALNWNCEAFSGETLNSTGWTLSFSDKLGVNSKQLEEFCRLAYTIGNFTVLPAWMNMGRNLPFRDYLDLTLISLRKFLLDIDETEKSWRNFVEKYYLNPFVNSDYTVPYFWENHQLNTNPQKAEDLNLFFEKVNLSIKNRGEAILKELFSKYCPQNKHNQNCQIKFADELWRNIN